MKIQAPAENRITIELSARDMDALNITYEQMDYSNIETRRVHLTLSQFLSDIFHALRRIDRILATWETADQIHKVLIGNFDVADITV